MKPWIVGMVAAAALGAPESAGTALRAHLRQTYPSLSYVERYRQAFPDEVQGSNALWSPDKALPPLRDAQELVQALVGLEDQHVALAGAKAGSSETLGLLFRTSTDGHMVVWRVFDPAGAAAKAGDEVVSIDGVPTGAWLQRAASATFGGNRRSRAAEAALNLGLGTRVVHQVAGVGEAVTLLLQAPGGAPRKVVLNYQPMNEARAGAMSAAVNQADLPRLTTAGGRHIGALRLGAFAPQYDPAFTAASDEAAKDPKATEDAAMVAGFCAVVRNFIADFDAVAAQSEVVVLDLRGNLGGFGREARLLAAAMAPSAPPAALDLFATGKPGVLKLVAEPSDPSCGHVTAPRPVVVLTDAGTRSAGELMAAWMWATGSPVVGERTVGAGGGFEFGSQGFALPDSGFNVRTSGNFTLFDPTGHLAQGETAEAPLVEQVAVDGFGPSRARPFAIQAAGLRPDLASPSTLADLRDGGAAQVERALTALRARHLVP